MQETENVTVPWMLVASGTGKLRERKESPYAEKRISPGIPRFAEPTRITPSPPSEPGVRRKLRGSVKVRPQVPGLCGSLPGRKRSCVEMTVASSGSFAAAGAGEVSAGFA